MVGMMRAPDHANVTARSRSIQFGPLAAASLRNLFTAVTGT
jgi:hypothetical protein